MLICAACSAMHIPPPVSSAAHVADGHSMCYQHFHDWLVYRKFFSGSTELILFVRWLNTRREHDAKQKKG